MITITKRGHFLYKPTVRVTYDMLPSGTRWYYVEAPPDLVANMAGTPLSEFEHGIIATHERLGFCEQNAAKLESHLQNTLW